MLWPRFLWLRGLGLIFLSAFFSLASQIHGLIGPRGILPASELFEAVGRTPSLSATPSFTAPGSGDVVLQLVVSDGILSSDPVRVTVHAGQAGGGGGCGCASSADLGSIVPAFALLAFALRRKRRSR